MRYPAHLEQAILAAKAAGQEEVELPAKGRIASAKYPHGATYSIDLESMEQTNASSGYSRDVIIVPEVSCNDCKTDNSDALSARRNYVVLFR